MSVGHGIIECMFDEAAPLVESMVAATRAENRAAGARLAAIGELDLLRLRQVGERETWCTDTQEAIAAEVAAALCVTQALATSYLYYARTIRTRLSKVGALLQAGDVSYRTFQTIAYRTDLITDPEVMAAVDARLAAVIPRWPAMTQGRLASYVDRMVARADRDAVRRRRERQAGREFSIWDNNDGLTEVFGRLMTTDAHAVDARLDALAATVCGDDPRTRNQRRADAMGALAVGADRLTCRCGQPNCLAGAPVSTAVVIHVVAEQASLDGAPQAPGSMIGSDALIPPELLAELFDDRPLDVRVRERTNVVLQRAQLENDVRRHHVRAHREQLPKLHEGWAELVEHLAQMTTPRCRSALVGRAAAPVDRVAESMPHRDLSDLTQPPDVQLSVTRGHGLSVARVD